MARTDWSALVTEPAAEYDACTELQRFGIAVYLPQYRKRVQLRSGTSMLRRYPLFPRYLLIPSRTAHDPTIRIARGVSRHRPILADADGRLWRCPAAVVDAVRLAESQGEFDEKIANGSPVRLVSGVLSCVAARMCGSPGTSARIILPLFGGARATVSPDQLVRA